MSSSRQRPHLKRPVWIIILVTFVIIFLITAYVYPPTSSAACYIFSSRDCSTLYNQPPTFPSRELSDDETISQVVIKEILKTPPIQLKNSKIAFLFLTPGTLPFEALWAKFFHVRLCSLVINIFVLTLHQLCNFLFASIANKNSSVSFYVAALRGFILIIN